jgi:hypothetical protein
MDEAQRLFARRAVLGLQREPLDHHGVRPREIPSRELARRVEPAAPQAPGCEAFDACGAPKFLCVATTVTTDKLDQTYAQIAAALDGAMADVDSLTPTDGFSFAPVAPLLDCK